MSTPAIDTTGMLHGRDGWPIRGVPAGVDPQWWAQTTMEERGDWLDELYLTKVEVRDALHSATERATRAYKLAGIPVEGGFDIEMLTFEQVAVVRRECRELARVLATEIVKLAPHAPPEQAGEALELIRALLAVGEGAASEEK